MALAYRIVAAAVGWFALVLQYWLVIVDDIGPGAFASTTKFFSYFTILTNIIAALALTLPWLAPRSALGQFFVRPSIRTGIAAYIIVVMGVVYVVLRHISNFEGLNLLADILLHYVMPVLFVIDWLLFVPKGTLKARDVPSWLAFPLVYLVGTLLHGALSGFYPYPFVDAGTLGYPRTLLNSAVLFGIFAALGLMLVALDRALGRSRRQSTTSTW